MAESVSEAAMVSRLRQSYIEEEEEVALLLMLFFVLLLCCRCVGEFVSFKINYLFSDWVRLANMLLLLKPLSLYVAPATCQCARSQSKRGY